MQIHEFLQSFKKTIVIISSSIYLILSTTISLYNTLINYTENTIDSMDIDPIIKEAAKKCWEKLTEYYNKISKTYLVATILDPRFKMQYYENNKWEDMIVEIYEI